MIRIYPYREYSRSANRLARILKGQVLKPKTSFVPLSWDVVINWGNSECPYTNECRVLNPGPAVKIAANKREAFRVLQQAGVSIPKFATSIREVTWEGLTVVRHKLTGHSGEGIELVEAGEKLPDAPLYVEYVKKETEYRIHVIGDKVTTVQRKGRRADVPADEVDWKVRNHRNGFIFVRQNINPPQSVMDLAVSAIQALGLDFGAVDLVWNAASKTAYVLEVNTAPGMEGSTIGEYAEGFKELLAASGNASNLGLRPAGRVSDA